MKATDHERTGGCSADASAAGPPRASGGAADAGAGGYLENSPESSKNHPPDSKSSACIAPNKAVSPADRKQFLIRQLRERASGGVAAFDGDEVEALEAELAGVIAGQPDSKPATANVISQRVKVSSCGCGSRFCPRCSRPLGAKLRTRLVNLVQTWPCVFMLTMTIDPAYWPSALEAFEYVRKRSCICNVVKRLHREGHLLSSHYFVVLEFQANGWPHWHVLVQSHRVPFDALCAAWNDQAPKHIKRQWDASQGRVGFGSVKWTKLGENAHYAVGYVAKYLTKEPEQGWPDWVLDRPGGYVHRYSVSKGFWGKVPSESLEVNDSLPRVPCGHEPECFCESCRGDYVFHGDGASVPVVEEHERTTTIRDRLARCGEGAVVIVERLTEHGDESRIEREVIGKLRLGYLEAAVLWAPNGIGSATRYSFEPRVTLDDLRPYLLGRVGRDARTEFNTPWEDPGGRRVRMEAVCPLTEEWTRRAVGHEPLPLPVIAEAVPEPLEGWDEPGEPKRWGEVACLSPDEVDAVLPTLRSRFGRQFVKTGGPMVGNVHALLVLGTNEELVEAGCLAAKVRGTCE